MSSGTTFLAGLKDLPLRTERAFRPWSYSVSHRRLVLRTWEDDQKPVLEVEFENVTGMKLRQTFADLYISEARTVPEIDEFVDIPKVGRRLYRTLLLSDGTHEGFVVCSRMQLMRL
ncbi:hypothetical protein ACIQI7_26920 [Kitasatospora sp. NPDC092039]|uniref:hypothetical protein n=1 Tax=Kitasatospora sp. NPDC092039 TaxID=3364086 RepID=UPI003822CF8F